MAQMGFFELSDRYASLDAKKDALRHMGQSFRPRSENAPDV